MRLRSLTFFVLALPAGAQERTYHFTNPPPSTEAYQQLATVIRTVTHARNVSINANSAEIQFTGRDESPEVTEWLLRQLDKPIGAPAPSVVPEYAAPGSIDGSVRVFTLKNTTGDIGMLEVLTILRMVADAQLAFNYKPLHAIAVRGKPLQLAMSEWLIAALDQPAGTEKPAMQEFRAPNGGNEIVRVYSLSSARSPQDLQNITTALRTTGGVKNTFSSRAVDAIALRGTSDQLANADAIIVSMDKQLAH